jgi:membrane protein
MFALAPSLFTLIGFLVLYIGVPNCKVKFRHALGGAVVATILFEASKQGFAYYILKFPTYELVYGAFSAIPIFLVWMYISWLIVLLGAEICYASTLHYRSSVTPKLDGFTQAYRWLGYLCQAQQRGEALSLEELGKQDHFSYEFEPRVMMQYLLQANIVEQTKDENFILKQDLSRFSLYDLYVCLPLRLPKIEGLTHSDQWQKKLSQVLSSADKNMHQAFNLPLLDFYQTK